MTLAPSMRRAVRLSRLFPLQVSRSRQLFSPRPIGSTLAYMGYSHFGNVGDDLIYAAHERTLPATLALLPTEFERSLLRVARAMRPEQSIDGILLGGGTIVGRTEWRRRVTNAKSRIDAPVIATGVGIEDPEFTAGRRNYEDFTELEQWRSVFDDSPHISVRGPRSQELLWRVGIDSTVASDTALILAPDVLTIERPAQPRIGVAFAVAGDQDDPAYMNSIREVVQALHQLTDRGWFVSMFVFDKRDLPLTAQIKKELGASAKIVETPYDVIDLLPELEACDVFTGQRLHSVVMASAVGVPSIALEYQPKCRDFQMSIGRAEWTLSTSEVTSSRLVDHIMELSDNRSTHSAKIREAVLQAKQGLIEDQHKIAETLFLSRSDRVQELQ